jgi:hypothetical protein
MLHGSPSRRSRRNIHSNPEQAYPFAPLLEEKLNGPPTNYGVLRSLYLAYLSRRHLHGYVLYLATLACLASAYLYRVEISALSFPALAWYFFCRPKIVVRAKARVMVFNSTAGFGPDRTGERKIKMAAVYVAPTGFKDEKGCDIMGLYANQFISRGYA